MNGLLKGVRVSNIESYAYRSHRNTPPDLASKIEIISLRTSTCVNNVILIRLKTVAADHRVPPDFIRRVRFYYREVLILKPYCWPQHGYPVNYQYQRAPANEIHKCLNAFLFFIKLKSVQMNTNTKMRGCRHAKVSAISLSGRAVINIRAQRGIAEAHVRNKAKIWN